jgi:uncharacterized membrane protein
MEANRQLLAKVVWSHIWIIQMWLAVLFFLYCSLRGLVLVIGREKVIRIFLVGKVRRIRFVLTAFYGPELEKNLYETEDIAGILVSIAVIQKNKNRLELPDTLADHFSQNYPDFLT